MNKKHNDQIKKGDKKMNDKVFLADLIGLFILILMVCLFVIFTTSAIAIIARAMFNLISGTI